MTFGMKILIVSAILIASSWAYRNGARVESCYNHLVDHDAFPSLVEQECTDFNPGCNLGGLMLIGEVNPNDFSQVLDASVTTVLTCGRVYRCKFLSYHLFHHWLTFSAPDKIVVIIMCLCCWKNSAVATPT